MVGFRLLGPPDQRATRCLHPGDHGLDLAPTLLGQLGVSLFDRSHRTVTLTPEGKAFHDAALRAIEAVEETDAAVVGLEIEAGSIGANT